MFLGAGSSKSSGIPLAGEMIAEWRRMIFEDRAPSGAGFDDWCKAQPWFEKDEEYSVLFEMLFPNERARQKFVEPKIEQGFPSWCYLYLANLVQAGHFNVLFTTNFDDLINDALSMYLGYNPVVCAADSEVLSINIVTRRAKVIKLHGDYLFKRLKNTVEDLDQLDPNMEAKFLEFSRQCGMIVLGYAGRDHSVMGAISAVMEDASAFPTGLFWAIRPGDKPHRNVADLAAKYPRRFQLFQSPSFDSFMVALHSRLGLKLPRTILQPYEAVKERFASLVGGADSDSSLDETIRSHIIELKKQLGRPWAKASDLASFDLLQAQLALGQRNHETALEYASNYCRERPNDPAGLTTWGDALALKAEAERCDAAGADAVAKWQGAIALDPESLPARSSLARYFWRTKKASQFLQAAAELLARVPNDSGLRRSVVQVYQQIGRSADALRELDILADREPDAPDLLAMRCAVYEQRGLIAEGIKAIERAVELEPGNAWYHYAYANGLLQTGRQLDAEREYKRSVDIDGSNLAFRLQIARFYAMRQQLLSAVEHLEAARTIEPDSGEVRGWLAELYLFQHRLEDARREVLEALRLSPGDVRMLVNAGIIHLRLGLPREAEEALSSSAAANTGVPQPFFWLAVLFWVQDRQADMKGARDRLLRMAPALGQQLGAQLSFLDMRALMNPGKRLQVLEEFLRDASGPPPIPSQPDAGWKAAAAPEGLGSGWSETIRSALARFRS